MDFTPEEIGIVMDLELKESQYRAMQKINNCLPKYEFDTSSMLPKRPTKTLGRHPTKRVKRSQKLKKIEAATTQAHVAVFNARSAANKVMKKHGYLPIFQRTR